jgi:DNA-binding LytR/AlgR family response regulator
VHFSADKNYTFLQLSTGKKLVFTFSLQKMEQYLSEKLNEDVKNFARIGKSHIINLNYVHQIDIARQRLLLFDAVTQKEFCLDLSKEALRNLRNLYMKK